MLRGKASVSTRSLLVSSRHRVLFLTAALAGAAVWLHEALLPGLPSLQAPLSIPWWAIAVAFALAEIGAVYVHFGRHAHSWSITEVPLTVGLVFTSPDELVVGTLVGYAAALILHRRQSVMKWSFNLAVAWLETVVALALHRALLDGGGPYGASGWIASYVAVGVATWGISALALPVAISLHEGRFAASVFRWVGLASVVSTVTNTSIGLLAVSILWLQPTAIWLLGLVVVVAVAAYRAYGSWRRRHDTLVNLHGLTELDSTRNVADVMAQLLEHARALLRAEVAELLLLSPEGGVRRHAVCGPPGWNPLTAEDLVDVAGLPDLLLTRRWGAQHHGHPLFRRNAVRDALLVVLGRGRGGSGVLLVANRLDDVSTFSREDLNILQTFGHHALVTIENSRLLDLLRSEAEDRRREALHDGLTGLPNRTAFQEMLGAAIRRACPAGRFAVLLLDLDHFKEVNDTLGHHIGDVLLRKVAERLRCALPPDCDAARLGGDEFVVLLPDGRDLESILALAEGCRAALTTDFRVAELQLGVEASIGVALYPEHGQDPSRLLQSADIAMYSAKHSGSQIEVYDSAVDAHTPRRLTLLGGLRTAIEQGELEVHYQPKAFLETGDVTGVEALVRWRHPDYGFIAPAEFLPLAEHSGLIHPVAQFVLRTALRQTLVWRGEGLTLEVAVNLSTRNLLDQGLPGYVGELLDEFSLPARALRFEITETAVMSDPHRTIPILEDLSAMGLGLSVDDFGTGYSSLSYLKGLPVDELKVDRSFVRDMQHDEGDAMIVRSTIDLGRNLGLRVVAEGVEDEATWQRLGAIGCDVAQGYLLLRPVAAAQLGYWLQQYRPREHAAAGSVRPRAYQ